jgi:hypothetical protein
VNVVPDHANNDSIARHNRPQLAIFRRLPRCDCMSIVDGRLILPFSARTYRIACRKKLHLRIKHPTTRNSGGVYGLISRLSILWQLARQFRSSRTFLMVDDSGFCTQRGMPFLCALRYEVPKCG